MIQRLNKYGVRMKTPHFSPLKQQKLGKGKSVQFIKEGDKVSLASGQARHIYKKGRKIEFN